VAPVVYKIDDIKKVLDEKCDRNSTGWIQAGVDNWGSSKYLDNFFLRPADPEKYKP